MALRKALRLARGLVRFRWAAKRIVARRRPQSRHSLSFAIWLVALASVPAASAKCFVYVSVYRLDSQSGTLQELDTLSTLPSGFAGRNTCADLEITPDGRFWPLTRFTPIPVPWIGLRPMTLVPSPPGFRSCKSGPHWANPG